jgi:hypothetical protein
LKQGGKRQQVNKKLSGFVKSGKQCAALDGGLEENGKVNERRAGG